MSFVGSRPTPPAVQLLGYRLLAADAEAGTAEVEFTGRPEFTNLLGSVQGGFVSAMLDATASSALLVQLDDGLAAPTIEMKTSFFRPVPTGRVIGRGRVLHRGTSIAFLEASLYDTEDRVLASVTATARVTRLRTDRPR